MPKLTKCQYVVVNVQQYYVIVVVCLSVRLSVCLSDC